MIDNENSNFALDKTFVFFSKQTTISLIKTLSKINQKKFTEINKNQIRKIQYSK